MASPRSSRAPDLYVGATNVTHNPFIFNLPPTLDHLRILFGTTLYPTWLFNTLRRCSRVVVAITLAAAVPAAYSLARLTGRWGERLRIAIFLTYLVPSTLLFIPFSRLVSLLGLQNACGPWSSSIPPSRCPFCTWLLMGFLKTLPKESRSPRWSTAAPGSAPSGASCYRSRSRDC